MNFKKVRVFRVKPGQDLLMEINRYCYEKRVTSAVILGIIGSLENARLDYVKRLPAEFEDVFYQGPLEITGGQGTVAQKENELIIHIHLQIANQQISTGGHLAAAKVFSTAEVSLAELDQQLQRYADSYTGLNELKDIDYE